MTTSIRGTVKMLKTPNFEPIFGCGNGVLWVRELHHSTERKKLTQIGQRHKKNTLVPYLFVRISDKFRTKFEKFTLLKIGNLHARISIGDVGTFLEIVQKTRIQKLIFQ